MRIRVSTRQAAAPALLVVLAVLSASSACADGVDDYVRTQMEQQHIPGLSLAIVKDGRVKKAVGYGSANIELNVRATPDTVYEIGSLTKQFTAAAILLLLEQGKLALDDRISKYVKNTPDTWKDITIRQLLTHTSGIKNYTDLPDFMNRTAVLPTTGEQLIAMVRGLPLEFTPGEKWDYSNTGYFLLGLVIENVSARPYAAFLQERIFTPLKMTATSVNDEKKLIPNRASGYHWEKGTQQNADVISMTWPYAAGAMISTVRDLARWDAALYNDTLLKKSSRDLMWTSATLSNGTKASYGFGWDIGQVRGHRSVRHGGGIPGFVTYISRFPDDGWTVIVLMNQDSSANPEAIADGILSQVFPAAAPVVEKKKTP